MPGAGLRDLSPVIADIDSATLGPDSLRRLARIDLSGLSVVMRLGEQRQTVHAWNPELIDN